MEVFKTVPDKTKIARADNRFRGISILTFDQDKHGRLAILTTGIAPVKVKGQASQGQSLCVSEGGGTFEAGPGNVIAVESTAPAPVGQEESTYVQRILAKIGESGSDFMVVDYITTSWSGANSNKLIDETNPPDPNFPNKPKGYYQDSAQTASKRIYADGHAVVEGDLILAANQPSAQQYVWKVKENDFWENLGRPKRVFVSQGRDFNLTDWGLWRQDEDEETDTTAYRIIRAGWH